jgi:hypothetical protein
MEGNKKKTHMKNFLFSQKCIKLNGKSFTFGYAVEPPSKFYCENKLFRRLYGFFEKHTTKHNNI